MLQPRERPAVPRLARKWTAQGLAREMGDTGLSPAPEIEIEMRIRRKLVGLAVPIVAALLTTPIGQVFAAPTPKVGGFASSRSSGYAVSDVRYALASDDPTRIEAVSFSLAPTTARRVVVRLVAAGGAWYPCTNAGGRATCETTSPQARLAAADTFEVVAAQD